MEIDAPACSSLLLIPAIRDGKMVGEMQEPTNLPTPRRSQCARVSTSYYSFGVGDESKGLDNRSAPP